MAVVLTIIFLSMTVPNAIATNSIATTEGWVSDPSGRGTFSLIFSCLVTLGLCVWSAMHLSIPPHDERPAQTWMRNLKWGLIGVVAPELVVFAAWRQYSSAKALHAEVQGILQKQHLMPSGGDKGDNTSKIRAPAGSGRFEQMFPWTMVHSFYAGMGGFVVEPDVSTAEGSLGRRLTLSARGIALLARCGHLPNINKQDIEDKSKADGLAKSLACLQAGWMVVQVVARVATGLSVTLLEVNTLGHVLCALVIYLLWWDKPRLVHKPTKLEGGWVGPIGAYMYISSQVSGWRSSQAGILRRTWIDPELSALAFFTPKAHNGLNDTNQTTTNDANSQVGVSRHETVDPPAIVSYSSDENGDNTVGLGYFGPRPPPLHQTGDTGEQTIISRTPHPIRWSLAAEAVQMYPTIRQRFAASHGSDAKEEGCAWLEPVTEELLTMSASNWPGEDLMRGTGGHVMGVVLWFASMAFGGVHIAAWNDYFPSTFETWMWRTSSIYITASGFIWLTINMLAYLSKPLDAYWDRVLALQAHRMSYLILGFLCFVCGVAYAFARIFLVVEAFISIRELPVSAYQTPDWTQIVPHI